MKNLLILCLLFSFFALASAGCSLVGSSGTPVDSDAEQSSTTPSPLAAGEAATVTIEVKNDTVNDAELHPLMLGVIAGPDPSLSSAGSPVLTKEYQEAGITSVRNNDYYDDRLDIEGIFNCGGTTYPSWEGCDASNDMYYDWTKSDEQYESWISGGFVPFLRIGGEYHHPKGNDGDPQGPQNATQIDNWIIAAKKMVGRYLNWGEKPNAFTYLDLWTEYPGAHFWTGTQADFNAFWAKAYAEIKAAYPNLKIGGPGMVQNPELVTSGKATAAKAFLTTLYKNGVKPDWFGWHIFNVDPTLYAQMASDYQDLLHGTGKYADVSWAGTNFFDGVEVFVDAYNSQTADPDDKSTKLTIPVEERASHMTAAWIALQYADIEGAYYYRGNDMGNSTDPNAFPGLFMTDGNWKTTGYAFRLWSLLTKNYSTLLPTNIPADATEKDVWALAAKNDAGGEALLLSNVTDHDVIYSVRSQSGQLVVSSSVYLVNANEHGTEPSVVSGSNIILPGQSVELVEFSP